MLKGKSNNCFTRDKINQSSKIFINSRSTKSCITLVLFHMRFCPTTKSAEIWEWGWSIVVSIPQRLWCYCMASCCASEDWLPHVFWCINSCTLSFSLNFIYQISDELTVAGSIMSAPRTSAAWVCFDINPNSSIEGFIDCWEHFIDLSFGWFSSAWEHVNIGI